jgi:hypothetical protein
MNVARAPCTAALLSALALLGACGGSSDEKLPSSSAGKVLAGPGVPSGSGLPSGSGRPAGSNPPSGSAAGACRARARSVCVTAPANGRTVAVGVGWVVEVDLYAPNSTWSDPVALAPRLLRQSGEVRRVDGGVSVAYRAIAPGKTELRAFERPLCRPARACPQFILVWLVHIRVSGE